MKKRQKVRKGIILFSFFLFPATFYYMSPYLIIDATLKGIVNGSFIIFSLMFISSLVVGRGFCAWLCPVAGCLDGLLLISNKKVVKGDFVKWIIWTPWIISIAILAIKGGGYKEIDFFYRTKFGLSITHVYSLIVYISLVLLIAISALIVGKRSVCHHVCWMAPFMILGRKIRNATKWSSLQLIVNSEKCKHCHVCINNCPMSLRVEDMVEQNNMENAECILCGTCIDVCKENVIQFSFGKIA
jgi:polyferredoxin